MTPVRQGLVLFVLVLALALSGCASRVPPSKGKSQPAPSTELPDLSGGVETEGMGPSDPSVGVAVPEDGEIKVALLVPLSGRHGRVGEALVNAAQMALFDVADDSFSLLVHDTGGNPNGAQAATRMALGSGVNLILGPLFAGSARVAAAEAQPLGINVVTFSNDRSIAGPGLYVMGLSPADQVERVVAYSAGKGLRRFAILAPHGAYGDIVKRSLQETAFKLGLQVTQAVGFDPRQPDVSAEVKSIAPRGSSSAADAAYDAIMLPMGGKTLLSVSPLLPYYDIDPGAVRFLGTALWDNPALGAEPALQGGWFAAPPPALWQNFKSRYEQLYGAKPPRIATLAYDATALAAIMANRASETGAERLFDSEGLTQPSGFSGVDGIFRFLPSGEAQRGLAVMEMRRGGFRLLSPAPQSFEDLTS